MYLFLINGAYVTWLITGQPLLPTYFIPAYHSYLVFIGVIISQGLFFLSCSTGPGTITKETQDIFDHQVYDGTVFIEGAVCSTCNTKKVNSSETFLKYTLRSLVLNIALFVVFVSQSLIITVFGWINASGKTIIDSFSPFLFGTPFSSLTQRMFLEGSWSVRPSSKIFLMRNLLIVELEKFPLLLGTSSPSKRSFTPIFNSSLGIFSMVISGFLLSFV